MTVPLARKSVLRLESEQGASKAAAVLAETPAFDQFAIVIREEAGGWHLECYDDSALAKLSPAEIGDLLGVNVFSIAAEVVPEIDWVAETQRGLAPIQAGRFLIHGSHDRGKAPSQWAIEIDAGRAFGTAHHGTTRGCLLAIEMLARLTQPKSILDLGAGSGVLAIAAAKAFRHGPKVVAMDIDPVAVAVARENCKKNDVLASVRCVVGDGKRATDASAGQFDMIMANILAKPLLHLAPNLRARTKLGGMLILSGLLNKQAAEIIGRYRSVGFWLSRGFKLEGWTTIILVRAR
jgi:ribosomal protein L11 methyltransferase